MIANALGLPIHVPAKADLGAAFGAARLGLIAATGADPLTVCTPPKIAETIEPDVNLGEAFAQAYRRYRALYPAICKLTDFSSLGADGIMHGASKSPTEKD